DEINFEARMWIVPPDRMKRGREHRVPLSDTAMALLKRVIEPSGEFLFPGSHAQQPLSNMALLKVLERLGRGDIAVHGFRSTFKDWARECTHFANEISEAALSHVVGDKTEIAYARGDLFDKRRLLMEAWEEYCAKPVAPAKLLAFRK